MESQLWGEYRPIAEILFLGNHHPFCRVQMLVTVIDLFYDIFG